MKYVCVVPFAYRPYFDEFRATLKIPEENCLFVDDTDPVGGIGIMRAHNMGVDFMHERDADWLIVMSASIRFGEQGGLDFLKILEDRTDLHVINGAGKAIIDDKEQVLAMGYHLTAFRRDVIDAIGRWDENFTPYSLDDVDLTLRMRKAIGIENLKIDSIVCDMEHTTRSHSISIAGVKASYAPRHSYFIRKWGREGGHWQSEGYEHPFNDPDLPITFWPDRDHALSIWQTEYKTGGFNYYD